MNLTAARRTTIALMGTALVVCAAGSGASAKEVASGGTAAPATCNPVTSLGYKGDATTGETGVATVQVDYGVKSCTKNAVTVSVTMLATATASTVLYADTAAPLSGRFTVAVTPRTSYSVRVAVYDATNGALQGSQTIFAAAVPKRV